VSAPCFKLIPLTTQNALLSPLSSFLSLLSLAIRSAVSILSALSFPPTHSQSTVLYQPLMDQDTTAKMNEIPAITIGGKNISGGSTITQDKPPGAEGRYEDMAPGGIGSDGPTLMTSGQPGQQEEDEVSNTDTVNLYVTIIPFSSSMSGLS
jgi:hypothetical protein